MTPKELIAALFAADAEIVRLTEERDEARRQVCRFEASIEPTIKKTLHFIAHERGWDCFKEGKQ